MIPYTLEHFRWNYMLHRNNGIEINETNIIPKEEHYSYGKTIGQWYSEQYSY